MKAPEVKDKIIEYFKKPDSNYACMINGEWGSGKTKLFRDDIAPETKNISIPSDKTLKFKSLYISLAGVNSLERLKELMFEHIESSERKETLISKDIAKLRGNIAYNDKPGFSIPENIFYCFDDLERINPNFMSEAFGFINLYIEHYKQKVIFLCDETQIDEGIKNTYFKSKEKYIRSTYHLEPDFCEVLSERKILNQDEENYLLSKINKAELKNFRTVFAILDFAEEIFTVFDSFDHSEWKIDHINRVRKLILFYTFFIASEKNRGVDISILRGINFPSNYFSELHLPDLDFGYDAQSDTIEIKEKIEGDEGGGKLEHEILSRHFDMESTFPNNEKVERFDSIADFILMGHLSADKLEGEVDRLMQRIKSLEGTREKEIINILNNFYSVGDENFSKTIESIIESVKIEEFSLNTYLSIFNTLLHLESLKIENINVNDELIEVFKQSIARSIKKGRIEYIPDLEGWFYDNNFQNMGRPKISELIEYIEPLLKNIPPPRNFSIEKLKNTINTGNKSLLDNLIVNDSDYCLKQEDASELFIFFLDIESNNIELFSKSLNSRYALRDGITPASYEKEFIIEMVKLIKNYQLSVPESRPLKFIPLRDLKVRLERYIKYYKLDKDEKGE